MSSDTPLRILIVEDSEDDALLLVRHLRHSGYTLDFEQVDNSESLRNALSQNNWDLVVTDHNMPGFDSKAALSLVKESGLDLPVIIVSGSIGEDIAVEAMKSGAHDYIMKGNLARLAPAIERELREAETRRAHLQAEKAIHHMAYHDVLTGLVNRAEFESRLSNALKSAKQEQLNHTLLFMDLDQFKVVNDTCGHAAGDELLKQLATVLHTRIRERDTLARLGGDEFCVLLENCPLEKAQAIADDLRQLVQDFRFVWQDRVFIIGVSIGVVSINKMSSNVSELLSAADFACYAAKDKGRNCIQIYREGDAELEQRRGEMDWTRRIDQALEENRFLLYQQPIISLNDHTDAPVHYEFLLRLIDSNNDIISPGAFIPAAERYRRMSNIDRWVINAAFKYLSTNSSMRPTNSKTFISINLSGQSLSDEELFDFVSKQLDTYQINPESICFEITETTAIANFRNAVDFINRVKSIGIRFALDDFGSGLSSFSYLKSLPVDYLKIDGAFVRNIVHDPMDRAIVEAINQIGHQAGIQTIAEYVETFEIQECLKTIGVDYAQGFAIKRPTPIDENKTINS